MVSRMFSTPVTSITRRSKPRPKPAWGQVPYLRKSRYLFSEEEEEEEEEDNSEITRKGRQKREWAKE